MSRNRRTSIAAALILAGGLCAAQVSPGQGPGVALVVGNSSYSKLPALRNPVNDAKDLSASFTSLGYVVTTLLDASLPQMEKAVRDFAASASKAKSSVFYYAGHGVQSGGLNYLLPADADIKSEADIKYKSLAADLVLEQLDASGCPFNLIVFDACRDNPFSLSRSASRGLSVVGAAPRGSIVVYATSPGKTAADGEGRNGTFSASFLAALADPGIEIKAFLDRVGSGVQAATGGAQVPWVLSSYFGSFYLQSPEEALAAARARDKEVAGQLSALQAEIAARQTAIEGAKSAEQRQALELEQRKARAAEEAARLRSEAMAGELARLKAASAGAEKSKAAAAAMDKIQTERLAALREESARQLASLRGLEAGEADPTRLVAGTLRARAAIAEVASSYDASWASFRKEIGAELDKRRAEIKSQTQDPFETKKEYSDRIAVELASLERDFSARSEKRKADLEAAKRAAVKEAEAAHAGAVASALAAPLELGPTEVELEIGAFDAERKAWPVKAVSKRLALPAACALDWAIPAPDRETLKNNYYDSEALIKARAIGASLSFRLSKGKDESSPWTLILARARLLDLSKSMSTIVELKPEALAGFVDVSAKEPFFYRAKALVQTWPVGARVSIDEGPAQDSGTPLLLGPGPLRVKATWPDGSTATRSLELAASPSFQVIHVERGEEKPGSLSVTAPPESVISIDGADRRVVPKKPAGPEQFPSLKPGMRKVRIDWKSGRGEDRMVCVESGLERKLVSRDWVGEAEEADAAAKKSKGPIPPSVVRVYPPVLLDRRGGSRIDMPAWVEPFLEGVRALEKRYPELAEQFLVRFDEELPIDVHPDLHLAGLRLLLPVRTAERLRADLAAIAKDTYAGWQRPGKDTEGLRKLVDIFSAKLASISNLPSACIRDAYWVQIQEFSRERRAPEREFLRCVYLVVVPGKKEILDGIFAAFRSDPALKAFDPSTVEAFEQQLRLCL